HRVGGDLDEHAEVLGGQPFDGVGEADGLPQVGTPVGGVEGGGVDPLAGDGGQERHPGGARLDGVEQVGQFVEDGGDVPGVGGVVDGDDLDPDVAFLQVRDQLVQRVGV